MADELHALGRTIDPGAWDGKLEMIEVDPTLELVTYTSDEVTAVCPVTGQPDWYTVVIELSPRKSGIESKSLKLYLQGYRNEGIFCEALAAKIAYDVWEKAQPRKVKVTVIQKSRGGISISAASEIGV